MKKSFNFFTILAFLLSIKSGESEELLSRSKRQFEPGWKTTGARADAWSHHVALCLQDSTSSIFTCGGSIIDDYWILTAAHCLITDRGQAIFAQRLQVKVGATVQRQDSCLNNVGAEGLYDVARIVFHPYFRHPLRSSNDIALLKLARPITFARGSVEPIRLHRKTSPIQPSETCIAMGFGETVSTHYSKHLTQVQLKIQTHRECIDFFRREDPANCGIQPHTTGAGCIDTSMFCAGVPDGSVDTCRGDSGGSLVCKKGHIWYLAGITSFGLRNRPCGQKGYGVYSNTDRMIGFIDETIYPNARVSEIKILITRRQNENCPSEYTHRIQADFNFGGEYFTYFCYKKTTRGPFLTGLEIVQGADRSVSCPAGYRKLNKDIQYRHQYEGKYVFLCYRYGTSRNKISDIISFDTFRGYPEPSPPAYTIIQTHVGHNAERKVQLAYKTLPL